jgi:hypothetical protein
MALVVLEDTSACEAEEASTAEEDELVTTATLGATSVFAEERAGEELELRVAGSDS